MARKIGDGHASAMFRQGLAELRGAFYNESNVAQQPQYGLYGTATPGEVAEDRRDDGPSLDEQRMDWESPASGNSVMGDRMKQAEQNRDDAKRDEPDRGMERD
jgi:hypothetical protein